MKVAIITDSSAGLPSDLLERPDVYVVNLTVNFPDGDVLTDSTQAESQTAFYAKLNQSKTLPTTSQPPAGDYMTLMDEVILPNHYDAVFGVFISGGISGTYQTAAMVLDDYQDQLPIYLIDSKGASVIEEFIVRHIIKRVAEGIDLEQIYQEALWLVEESQIYLTVENLTNLSKGGRLSGGSALIGNLLKIKPLMVFDNQGAIVLSEKLRTDKKVTQRWCDLVSCKLEKYPAGIEVWFAHGNIEAEIQQIADTVQAAHPSLPVHVRPMCCVIGTHLGEGGRGIALIPTVDNYN